MARPDGLFCDGAFAVSPMSLHLAYVARAVVGVSPVTGARCILNRKTRPACDVLTRKHVEICAQIGVVFGPDQAISDFESGTLRATHTFCGAETDVTT